MGMPSRFVVCYTTTDGVRADLHAYADGDGSLRDNNHVREIVREFTRGNEGAVRNRPPADGERVMFEIVLHVCATRRGRSNYFGCDYRQIQPCPHCVAEAGMDIYVQIKHLLRRARKEKKNAIARRRATRTKKDKGRRSEQGVEAVHHELKRNWQRKHRHELKTRSAGV